ncbi:MAG: dethiobiotin synthase [Nannocystaceae bacterium]
MPRRIFLVGTDTEAGKTAVAAALLRHARGAGARVLPFKPAASGGDDPERLVAAAGLDPELLPRIAPLRYDPPLAPGIAADRLAFVAPARGPEAAAIAARGAAQIAAVAAGLAALEAELRPTLTIIEGAGGWHVPMPGGTWLPAWVDALDAAVVVVGRLGLGTINHTLLTIDALRGAGHSPLGFILSATVAADDPSTRDNPEIIAQARGLPLLGLLARDAATIELRDGAWERLLGAA